MDRVTRYKYCGYHPVGYRRTYEKGADHPVGYRRTYVGCVGGKGGPVYLYWSWKERARTCCPVHCYRCGVNISRSGKIVLHAYRTQRTEAQNR
eukprot:scaffold250265_cov68-Attheya_sp.AAC.2